MVTAIACESFSVISTEIWSTNNREGDVSRHLEGLIKAPADTLRVSLQNGTEGGLKLGPHYGERSRFLIEKLPVYPGAGRP